MTTDSSPGTLQRRLGPIDAAAIVISNVIGSGILITPAFVAMLVPSPVGMLTIWLVGGVLALAGAMAYAELSALLPKAGGEYVFLRAAFGRPFAFLTGWTSFVAGFSGAIAAASVALATYLGRFFPAAADATPLLSIGIPWGYDGTGTGFGLRLVLSPQSVVALTAILLLSFVHSRGLGPGRAVQNGLAVLKVTALLVFVALGLSFGRGSMSNLTMGTAVPATNWLLALIPVMFSYSGWNAAAYLAEEVRDPSRNVPRALGIGTLSVVLIYLSLNFLYFYALPVGELTGLQVRVVDAAAERLFGAVAGDFLAALTVLILAASISAMVLAGPRVYYAMARDGLFFKAAARVHPTHATPSISIWAQAAWSCVLVLTGTFGQLVDYTGFAVVLFSGIAVLGLFVLRFRYPDSPRPFKAWGYPIAPGIFALASMAIVINAIRESPRVSGAGLLVMAAGIPLYFLMRWLHRHDPVRPDPDKAMLG